jgi:hypothetical protein
MGMKHRLKPAVITGSVFGAFNYYGTEYVGGDGFFADPSQAPVGSTPAGVIFSFIFGAVLGLIPWGNILKRIFKK